uniref:Uncharacterized protein n=1 Tax=Psilocybe cubensis TaxID=181762 RepID=A0A8H7XQ66_PSICU
MTVLHGWHRGERLVRQHLGFDKIPATNYLYSNIAGEMPDQHSTFYCTRLHFLPTTNNVLGALFWSEQMELQAITAGADRSGALPGAPTPDSPADIENSESLAFPSVSLQ